MVLDKGNTFVVIEETANTEDPYFMITNMNDKWVVTSSDGLFCYASIKNILRWFMRMIGKNRVNKVYNDSY